MRVRCPHCHHPIEVVDGDPLSQVDCPSCGSSFSLVATFETVSHEPRGPKKIAHFELIEQVGMGRFGSVWKARDTQLDRTVAIKVPRKGSLDAAESEQFLREARAAAQVRHPHLVPVHEVGRDSDSLYIVSDFIDGANLKDWLTAQRPTPREAAELCVTIAEALHAAHEAGVVHRDLKPGNILMDLAGRPHIADFGLARRDAGEITMTVEGRLLGTPAYMSPEQAKGEGHTADRRSDVYSLGVILYELLTGELPFRGETRMLVVQVIRDEPPSPRKLNARIPRDLETIALKCLEKDPGRRYPTAQALADDLRRYLAGEAIHARPIGHAARAVRWCRRKPVAAALIALAALFLLVLGMGGPMVAIREAGLRTKAQTALDGETAALGKAQEQTAIAEREVAETQRQLRVANALRLSAESGFLREKMPVRSALLAIEACEATVRYDIPLLGTAEEALRGSLENLGGVPVIRHDDAVNAVAFSADGRWLAAAGLNDTTASLIDLSSPDPLGSVQYLRSHEDRVTCLAFSPDGRWLATGSFDHTIRLWDLRTPQPLLAPLVLRGHEKWVDCLAFSPDGHWLFTGGWDATARIWDMTSLDPEANPRILRFDSSIEYLAISPNGRWLATAGNDETAWLTDLTAADPEAARRSLPGNTRFPVCLAISPDSRWLAIGNYQGGTHLWDLSADDLAKSLQVLPGTLGGESDLAFSPDSRRLLTGAHDGLIRMWDLGAFGAARTVRVLGEHPVGVSCQVISPDGRWLVTCGWDNTARVWNIASPDSATVPRVVRHDGYIQCVAISPDGRWLATGSIDKSVRIWDLAAPDAAPSPRVLWEHSDAVSCLAIGGDGRLVTGSWDGAARLWNLADDDPLATPLVLRRDAKFVDCTAISPDGRWVATWCVSGGQLCDVTLPDPAAAAKVLRGQKQVRCTAFTPDGRWLVSGDNTGDVRLWDVSSPDPDAAPVMLRGHTEGIACLVVSPDGRWLVTGSWDDTARMWNLTAPDPSAAARVLSGHENSVASVAISRDGRWLATGDLRVARLWDISAPDAAPRILSNDGYGAVVAFSPDGRWLVSASDQAARVWDLASADPSSAPRVLRGHDDYISRLAITPDGRWLATGSADETVRLWDLSAADPSASQRVLRGHTYEIFDLAIDPDGRWLVTASLDRTARVWDLRIDDLRAIALSRAGRQLSAEERRRYGLDEQAAEAHRPAAGDGGPSPGASPWRLPRYPLNDAAWHKTQAIACLQLDDKFALLFHLDRLGDWSPSALDQGQAPDDSLASFPWASAEELNTLAWAIVSQPGMSLARYEDARAWAEAAGAADAAYTPHQNTLGAAFYRLERYDEALAVLAGSKTLEAAYHLLGRDDEAAKALIGAEILYPHHFAPYPVAVAFLAMTHHRIGHAEESSRRLAELRTMVQGDMWKSDAELQRLLAEAEALIEGDLPRREDLGGRS